MFDACTFSSEAVILSDNKDNNDGGLKPFQHREGWQPAQKGYQANPNANSGKDGNANFDSAPTQSGTPNASTSGEE